MNTTLRVLTLSSTAQLQSRLAVLSPGMRHDYAALAMDDPRLVVCPFEYTGVKSEDIERRVVEDIVGLLSLPLNDVVYDYQIFLSTAEVTTGCFLCLPLAALQPYLDILDRRGCIPVTLTSLALLNIETFLTGQTRPARFCLLDFSNERYLTVSVLNENHCVFLRQIVYATTTDVKQEVLQSLRSFFSQNIVKEIEEVFIVGPVPDGAEFIKTLRDYLQKEPKVLEARIPAPDTVPEKGRCFALNLLKDYAMPLAIRWQTLRIVRLALLGVAALVVVVTTTIVINGQNLRAVKLELTAIEQQYNTILKYQPHAAKKP